MNALFIILLLIIVIFTIYVVYSINDRGFSNYSVNDIWKSIPGKYEAFTSMNASPFVPTLTGSDSYNKVDKFGLIDSSMKCSGSSYYNLNGNICLNDEQKMLLTTRGGNSKTGTKYESM